MKIQLNEYQGIKSDKDLEQNIDLDQDLDKD